MGKENNENLKGGLCAERFQKEEKISQKDIREVIAAEFDEQFYKTNYAFLVTELEPLDHFLEVGWEKKDTHNLGKKYEFSQKTKSF